jgi:hypothetical protein
LGDLEPLLVRHQKPLEILVLVAQAQEQIAEQASSWISLQSRLSAGEAHQSLYQYLCDLLGYPSRHIDVPFEHNILV